MVYEQLAEVKRDTVLGVVIIQAWLRIFSLSTLQLPGQVLWSVRIGVSSCGEQEQAYNEEVLCCRRRCSLSGLFGYLDSSHDSPS